MKNGDLGKRIKTIRINAGIKQKELAKKLGVTPNYLSLVECGKKQPSLPFMERLSKTLGAPINLFFLPAEAELDFVNRNQASNYHQLMNLLLQLYSELNANKSNAKT